MNPLSRKIIAGFSLVMLGIHLVAVTAGAAAQCRSLPCCCTRAMMHHDGLSPDIDSIDPGCCSSTQTIPCDLNQNHMPTTPILIVSTAPENMKTPFNGAADNTVKEFSPRQATSGNNIFNPFRMGF